MNSTKQPRTRPDPARRHQAHVIIGLMIFFCGALLSFGALAIIWVVMKVLKGL